MGALPMWPQEPGLLEVYHGEPHSPGGGDNDGDAVVRFLECIAFPG